MGRIYCLGEMEPGWGLSCSRARGVARMGVGDIVMEGGGGNSWEDSGGSWAGHLVAGGGEREGLGGRGGADRDVAWGTQATVLVACGG